MVARPPVAKSWWFGPAYAALLADSFPESSVELSGGAVVVSDPKWRPPDRLRTHDLTADKFEALEKAFLAAPDEATRERLQWQATLWIAPAENIPSFND